MFGEAAAGDAGADDEDIGLGGENGALNVGEGGMWRVLPVGCCGVGVGEAGILRDAVVDRGFEAFHWGELGGYSDV